MSMHTKSCKWGKYKPSWSKVSKVSDGRVLAVRSVSKGPNTMIYLDCMGETFQETWLPKSEQVCIVMRCVSSVNTILGKTYSKRV